MNKWRVRVAGFAAALTALMLTDGAPALDMLDLMSLKGEELAKAINKYIETEATNAPASELMNLFDPELNLEPDQLEKLYLMASARLTKREKYPALSPLAQSPVSGLAEPALRLLGQTANEDAFIVLKSRLADVAVAAIDGLGALGDARAVPILEPYASSLKPVLIGEQNWSILKPGISAAFALARLGKWDYCVAGMEALGTINQVRLSSTWNACRTTYNPPQQCKEAKDRVLRIKAWFRIMRPILENLCRKEPGRFAEAAGKCRQPYGIDMIYAVVEKCLNQDNAAALFPLMNSISTELKAMYLGLGEPFFDEATKIKIRETILEHAERNLDIQTRLFACAHAHWLPDSDRDALLSRMLKDETAWVRDQAARKAVETGSPVLMPILKAMAEKDPDSMVRATAGRVEPDQSRCARTEGRQKE